MEVLIEDELQSIGVQISGRHYQIETSRRRRANRNEDNDQFVDGRWQLRSPLTGVVNELRCKAGDTIEQNDVLLVIEAMKMLNELRARVAGRLSLVNVKQGDRVELGMVLLEISEDLPKA